MKTLLRKTFYFLIASVLLCTVSGCCTTSRLSTSSFGEILNEVEGVSSVTVIQQNNPIFKEKYIVTFSQPIDWNDFSKGTFEQRVEIGFQGYDNVCVYNVSGYCLNDVMLASDSFFQRDDRDEFCRYFTGNFINIEYRFFGESVPEGLSNDQIYLWDNLTVENASKDFYSIMQKLSGVLSGKRIITGHSKGGYVVNTMSLFYPDSFDAYISYVAPLCFGTDDPRLISSLFETVDKDGNPLDSVREKRKALIDFAVLCITERVELEDIFYQMAKENCFKFRDTMTKEILWDVSVLDFVTTYCQYGGDLNRIQEILGMPDSNETEHSRKLEEVIGIINEWGLLECWCCDSFLFPYFWESFTEIGQYCYDFHFIRDAVIAETGEDGLAVKSDMEQNLCKRLLFTTEQQEVLEYDDSVYNALLNWANTTESHVIMIFGELDPWFSVRIPETDNENIHRYYVESGSHDVFIDDLNEEDYNNCMKLITNWLSDS